MSTYVFKAIDVAGRQAKGELDAESKQSVADQLKAKGLIVLDIADKSRAKKDIELPWANRIKLGDLSVMTRQMATMVSSGMTILRALYVLEAQTENKKLAEELVLVRKDIEAGLPLSDALERHPKTFSPLYVAMTRAGETGGMLEESLLQVADQLEKEESLRRQVKSAMAYPIVIFVFAMAVMLGMVAFVAGRVVHGCKSTHWYPTTTSAGVRSSIQCTRSPGRSFSHQSATVLPSASNENADCPCQVILSVIGKFLSMC